MLPQLSLKSKIYTGIAIILALLAANSVVSYLGQNRLRTEVNRIQQIERISSAVLKVDRDVNELRLHVDRYVTSGYDSQREEADQLFQQLQQLVKSTKEELVDSDIANVFNKISVHVEEYFKQFQSVVEERRLRSNLIQVELPAQSLVVEQLFRKSMANLSGQESREDDLFELSQAQSTFLQAQKSLLRYYETPDNMYVNKAVTLLKTVEKKTASTGIVEEGQSSIQSAVHDYERLGLRAVQATRSYLYFLNVVMAAEASEVSYYSQQLREQTEQSRNQIASRVASTSNNVKRATGFTVAAATILSLLIAGRLVFQIVPPITALTGAFQKLSAGQSLSKIPGTERHDEIGDMAQAARVFSDQNEQTRKLLEQSEILSTQLQEKAAQLEANNEELDNFAYIASHDLKSPLRGIRQLATWIEEDSGENLTEESIQHLKHLRTRITKMETLLEDLLNYSRVGRVNLGVDKVNVNELLDEIVEMTDNPQQVAIHWENDFPIVFTPRLPFEQVLLNLVGNAIKHNDQGSQGLVEVDWAQEADAYRFTISDNGPGIEPKHHDRVFQMYQRVGSAAVDGSGMGLAIVKKQVEYFGGEVSLESKVGQGTKFEFTWPITSDHETEGSNV